MERGMGKKTKGSRDRKMFLAVLALANRTSATFLILPNFIDFGD